MMNEQVVPDKKYEIRYGDGMLSLYKSSKYIGIKPLESGRDDITDHVNLRQYSTFGRYNLFAIKDSVVKTQAINNLRETIGSNRIVDLFYTRHNEPDGLYIPTEVIYIEFKHHISSKEREKILNEYHLTLKETRAEGDIIALTTASSPEIMDIVIALQANDSIEFAEPSLATTIQTCR